MFKAVILDLCHDTCPQYNNCFQKRIKEVCSTVSSKNSCLLYILLDENWEHLSRKQMNTTSAALDILASQKGKVQILDEGCVTSSWYRFKQALDELDLSAVLVITSIQRKHLLEAYQSLLFTAVYKFEYETPFDDSRCIDCSNNIYSNIREEVTNFLRQLPAVTGNISVLKSSLISDCFSHGFTTRKGGISYIRTLRSLNLFSSSRRRDPRVVTDENLRRLSLQAGFDPKNFHLVKTDHGSDVWVIGKPEPESYDGIVTNRVGVVIAAPGADCIPLLFTDPVAKVIGVAHAGWKGTLKGIAMETVNAMVTEFGSKLTDITVVIGPSVGPCCFSLDHESAKEFHAIHPDCIKDKGLERAHVDIRLATRILLQQGGILPSSIQDDTVTDQPLVTLCTACNPDTFFSHVRDGLNFGTQIGFMWIKN